jgi:alpha-galactosidase
MKPTISVDLHTHIRKVMIFTCLLFMVFSLIAGQSHGQSVSSANEALANPIRKLSKLDGWVLQTSSNSYIIAKNKEGRLFQVYWGSFLSNDDQFDAAYFPEVLRFTGFAGDHRGEVRSEEYPAQGGPFYDEPCLKAMMADGNREVVLKYVSDKIEGNSLEILLKDILCDIYVTLIYKVYPEYGIISKKSEISNRTKQKITVESAQSGVWTLPADKDYRLTYLTGFWASEAHVIREPLHQGMKILESRRGITGYEFNPWFAVDYKGEANEDVGKVWFGALGWSGNWRISVEQTYRMQPRITGGYNTFDFGYLLKPGETLVTPPFYGGFTTNGFGEASRMLHRLQRNEIVPGGKEARLRPVFYNSWQTYEVDVTEANQMELAKKAADMGVELFLVDDGWFHLRKETNAGLGDWFVDTDKFPNGLLPLSRYVNSLGMDFGLWVEPEMVNPNSDLYRQHPDWVLNFPDRPRTEGRGQLVLNLAREDVKEYLYKAMDKLVTENNVKMFKWDMNRLLTEPGWPELPPEEQKKVWVEYTRSLYDIIDRLRAKHPGLEIESCKGGGGRIDMGMMERVDQFWTSDDTDPVDRLFIQEGFSFAYSPGVLMGRVSPLTSKKGYPNVRANSPLDFRFLIAMQGSLGLSLNPNVMSDEEIAEAGKYIDFYKTIKRTVQRGDLYRLSSSEGSGLGVNQFVSEDGKQSVVFALLKTREKYPVLDQPIYLRGLDANARYRIKPMHEGKLVEKIQTASGDYLENHGIKFRFPAQDMDGTVVVLEKL